MPAYVITGKLGAGKSLVAVSRIQQYLIQGRKVATNLNLFPEYLASNIWQKNGEIYRLPNKPTLADLNQLPLGHDLDHPDDSKNGALVFDECGTWLNSRTWNEKGRAEFIEWLRNARKMRWDIFFIIQDISVMDSQARESFAEHVVYCRRLDRFRVPFLHQFGIGFPKLHMGLVKYGSEVSSPTVDRWFYRGTNLYNAYDTEQQFTANDEIEALTRILPPYYTHGRYITRWEDLKNAYRNFKFRKLHFFLIGAFSAAFAVNALVLVDAEEPKKGIWTCNDAYKKLFGSCDAKPIAPYEYYYPKPEKKHETAVAVKGTKEKPKSDVIYIGGYEITTKGVNMVFVDSEGAPFYPSSYRVTKIRDCAASVLIDGVGRDLVCMPNEIALNSHDKFQTVQHE